METPACGVGACARPVRRGARAPARYSQPRVRTSGVARRAAALAAALAAAHVVQYASATVPSSFDSQALAPPAVRGAAPPRRLDVLGSPFTPGSVLVLRLGSGAAAVATTTERVFIDEYALNVGAGTGTLLQTLTLPTTSATGAPAMTIPGVATGDPHGQLERSENGRFVMFAAYDLAPGMSAYASANTRRVIATVSNGANVSAATSWMPGGSANYMPVAVASVDGTSRFWVAAGGTSGGGMQTVTPGGGQPTVIQSAQSYRSAVVYGAKLYGSRTNNNDIQTFPVALPTGTSAQASLTNNQYPDGRGFVWRSPTEFYVAEFSAQGMYRLTRATAASTTWTRSALLRPGNTAVGLLDLALSDDNATVFAITSTAMYAYDVATGTWPQGSTPILSAAANTAWRGVVPAPIPEPSPSPTPSPSASPSATPSPTPSLSVGASPSSTPSATPSITPTISETPSITPSRSPTASITPSRSATPSVTPTVSLTPSTTATAAASVDLAALARAAAEASKTDAGALTGAIVGGVVGAIAVVMLAVGGAMYASKRSTAARLRKLKASVEASRTGPQAYMSAWSTEAAGMKEAPQPTIIYQVQMNNGLTGGRGGGGRGGGGAGAGGLAAYGVPRGGAGGGAGGGARGGR